MISDHSKSRTKTPGTPEAPLSIGTPDTSGPGTRNIRIPKHSGPIRVPFGSRYIRVPFGSRTIRVSGPDTWGLGTLYRVRMPSLGFYKAETREISLSGLSIGPPPPETETYYYCVTDVDTDEDLYHASGA